MIECKLATRKEETCNSLEMDQNLATITIVTT